MLESLERKLSGLPTGVRNKLISQFHRMIKVEKNEIIQNDGVFEPPLEHGQVIKVEFVGLGSVMDTPHYAIVWDAHKTNEHIVVLPLTSQVRPGKSFYDIGFIDGLIESSHVVKANQPQSVSRKSIKIWKKGDGEPVKLGSDQLKKAHDLFRMSQLKEPLLRDVITNYVRMYVPSMITEHCLQNLDRPVSYSFHGDNLWYKVCDEDQMEFIKLTEIKCNSAQRKQVLKKVFSSSEEARKDAFTEIGRLIAEHEFTEAPVAPTDESTS